MCSALEVEVGTRQNLRDRELFETLDVEIETFSGREFFKNENGPSFKAEKVKNFPPKK